MEKNLIQLEEKGLTIGFTSNNIFWENPVLIDLMEEENGK